MNNKLLQAGQEALDNFANAMNKVKPISVKECSCCDSKVVNDNGKYYHQIRDYDRVSHCSYLDAFVPDQNVLKADGKFISVKTNYGTQHAFYWLMNK